MSVDEGLAQESQIATRSENGTGRGDAAFGDHRLAHFAMGQDVSISLRSADDGEETRRPEAVQGGFGRYEQQSSFEDKSQNALEKPKQDNGVMIVGPIIPRQGYTSAEPASALPDKRIIACKKRIRKIFFGKVETFDVEPLS